MFEAVQRVREVNYQRRQNAPNYRFTGKSTDDNELKEHPELELDFIRAVPRMAFYIEYSTRIYEIYLKYIAPEDIHVYSIDEVFMDVTAYLDTYKTTAHELARRMIRDVLENTGITATAGIGVASPCATKSFGNAPTSSALRKCSTTNCLTSRKG